MAIASPTLFICVVSVGSACGMVAVRKHLEGKARNLGDDVINARLEARGGFARDVVLEFVEHARLKRLVELGPLVPIGSSTQAPRKQIGRAHV